jgi:hypothetical protein
MANILSQPAAAASAPPPLATVDRLDSPDGLSENSMVPYCCQTYNAAGIGAGKMVLARTAGFATNSMNL